MLSTVSEADEKILKEVGLTRPGEYAVAYRDKDTIRLLHYLTRDIITIHRGDRPWPEERKHK